MIPPVATPTVTPWGNGWNMAQYGSVLGTGDSSVDALIANTARIEQMVNNLGYQYGAASGIYNPNAMPGMATGAGMYGAPYTQNPYGTSWNPYNGLGYGYQAPGSVGGAVAPWNPNGVNGVNGTNPLNALRGQTSLSPTSLLPSGTSADTFVAGAAGAGLGLATGWGISTMSGLGLLGAASVIPGPGWIIGGAIAGGLGLGALYNWWKNR